jgi:hypothetical protein
MILPGRLNAWASALLFAELKPEWNSLIVKVTTEQKVHMHHMRISVVTDAYGF